MWRQSSREYWRKVIGPYLGSNPQEKAKKYTVVLRVAYFFSVTSFVLYIFKRRKDFEQQLELESGRPGIVEMDPNYRLTQDRASKAGMIYKYNDKGVLEAVEFDKENYYQALEQETLERAKEAQRKALAEGRELPPDAIRLV